MSKWILKNKWLKENKCLLLNLDCVSAIEILEKATDNLSSITYYDQNSEPICIERFKDEIEAYLRFEEIKKLLLSD